MLCFDHCCRAPRIVRALFLNMFLSCCVFLFYYFSFYKYYFLLLCKFIFPLINILNILIEEPVVQHGRSRWLS